MWWHIDIYTLGYGLAYRYVYMENNMHGMLIYTYVYIHINICVHGHEGAHRCTHMLWIHTYVYIHMNICVHMYIDIYICIYTYAGAYRCIHMLWGMDMYIWGFGVHIWRGIFNTAMGCQRPDRGIYSISRGRSLCCLLFGLSQFMGPEAYAWIFVPVLLG